MSFECQQCGKYFSQARQLRTHERVHTSSTDKFNSVGSDADLFGREPIHSLFSTFAILFMAQTVLCSANLTQNLIQQVRIC